MCYIVDFSLYFSVIQAFCLFIWWTFFFILVSWIVNYFAVCPRFICWNNKQILQPWIKDGNGFVSFEEFSGSIDAEAKRVYEQYGSGYIATDARKQEMFNWQDRDGDNQISREEFAATMEDPTTDYGMTDEEYLQLEREHFETYDEARVAYLNIIILGLGDLRHETQNLVPVFAQ